MYSVYPNSWDPLRRVYWERENNGKSSCKHAPPVRPCSQATTIFVFQECADACPLYTTKCSKRISITQSELLNLSNFTRKTEQRKIDEDYSIMVINYEFEDVGNVHIYFH